MAKSTWYKTAVWKLDIPLEDKTFTHEGDGISLNHHEFSISVKKHQQVARSLPHVTLLYTSLAEDSSFSECRVKWKVTFIHPKYSDTVSTDGNINFMERNIRTNLFSWANPSLQPKWLKNENHCSLVVTIKLRSPLGKPKLELPKLQFSEEWDHSDVVFSVEGNTVHAHRQVLSVFSPIFRTMLYGNFKEKHARLVELPGKTHGDCVAFLRLLYPHDKSSDLDFDGALRLIGWFHEYQVVVLEDEAQRILIEGVTKDTALQCLEIADRYDYEELKNAALAKAALLTSDALHENPQFLEFEDNLRSLLFEMRALHLEK